MGDKEGARINYEWVPPSLLPQFLPWIAVLVLLLLPANRRPQAWWVLLPLGAIWLIDMALKTFAPGMFSDGNDLFALGFTSLAFGIAVLWLLSSYLAGLSRGVVFLVAALIISASSLLAYLVRCDLSEQVPVTVMFVVLLVIVALLIALGLVLSSLMCKRVYSPGRLLAWFGVFVLAGWLVISSPLIIFVLVVSATQGGEPPALYFLLGIGAFALATFAVMVPFLLLSFIESHYKQRVTALLRLPSAAPPPNAPPLAGAGPPPTA